MRVYKERVVYSIEDGQYCGHTVNLPIVVQADSFEKMKEDIKEVAKVHVALLCEMLKQDEPFEYFERDGI